MAVNRGTRIDNVMNEESTGEHGAVLRGSPSKQKSFEFVLCVKSRFSNFRKNILHVKKAPVQYRSSIKDVQVQNS